MQAISSEIQRLYDEVNPYSTANLILYFAWLVGYSMTMVAAWRARSVWTRFICFVLNQALQVGIFMSWSLTLLLALSFWLPTLLVFAGVVSSTYYVLRAR